MEISQVTIVGAGTMGSGIAQVCATAGLAVTLIDIDAAALARGRAGIEARLARAVERGRLSAAAAQAARDRLTTADAIEAAAGQVVIEAIVEALEAKLALFAQLDRHCPPETILASNTSSLSITRLGAATSRPERVIGLHFFNPAPVMRLIEVVRGLATSDATVAVATALAERLGKTPLLVNDAPGFVANRVMMPVINEAAFALMEGVASREAIDGVITLGFNHPLGPLALADLIGLDVCLAVMEALHHDLGDDKYRPCPLLRRMVAAGHLGRKTGRGFYTYEPAAGGRQAARGPVEAGA
jgi:3-hydroxybutyryl-CoA dehydrogenase